MSAKMLIGVAAAAAMCAATGAAAVEVPLTVTERAGVARVGNHVNSGVPLPMGAVKDVGELGLYTAGGTPVNAQITERCRWLKDKSLKFVTVHFACDLPAKGTVKYVLKSQSAEPAVPIKTTATADAVTVDTGVLKFVVKKANYTLFDQVWLGEAEVVAPGTAKVTLVATEGDYKVAAKIAKVNRESDAVETKAVARAIELEENGPVRAVVKVTGSFMKGDGKTLDFVARYHALAGSPNVRVTFTVVNRVGKKFESFVGISELSLTVPVKGAAGNLKFTFAGETENISGAVAPGKTATLLQLKSTEYTIDGKTHTGGRDSTSRRLGWVSLGDGKAKLAAGVRYVWQLYPKGLQVTGDGAVKVMLVAPGESASRAGAKGVPMFTGGARTHEVLFAFGGDGAAAMGVVDPLFAQAPTDWYCQKTLGFGHLYDSNLENFKPEHRDLIKGFQDSLDRSFAGVVAWKDGKRQGMEEYGFFNWGANVHHGTLVRKTGWIDTGWNGNYYDFPFASLVNFVRTGNPVYWDVAQAHALHLADIDVCHWHPTNQKLNGIEHVCYNIGQFRQFWGPEPFGVSGNADSTKNQSLYHCYYMTGDRWYLDVALLVSEWNAAGGGGSLRAIGNRMTGLYGSYEATHRPEHFDRWQKFVKSRGIGTAKRQGLKSWDQDWMYGLAAEGLMTYFRATGDLEAAEAVRTACDSLVRNFWGETAKATRSLPGFSANCFGYAYELTGDEAYLEKGLGNLAATARQGANRSKSFAQQFRLSPQFLYYLAADYEPPKPVLTEKRVFVPPKPKPPAAPKATVTAEKGEFPATRDIRIMTHQSEAEQNAGGGTRLRVRNANSRSGELTLFDFDGAAIKAFLDQHKDGPVTATLILQVLEFRTPPATLHVAPLRSTVDWNEGTKVQQAAEKGDACYAWAQKDKVRWTNAEGKEVPDARAIFYDRAGRKLLGVENSKTALVDRTAKAVLLELDAALVKDLAENENNRGLVLFITQDVDGPQALLDFKSRETRSGPKLVLTTGGASLGPEPPKPAAPTVTGNTGRFPVTRDARITCHPTEAALNSGGGSIVRVRDINSNSAELTILDFDEDAIRKFLDAHKAATVAATLTLNVQRIQNGPASLNVLALRSASDWGEGTGIQGQAYPGTCSLLWAQTDRRRWQTAEGKDIPDLRTLVYDRKEKKPLVLANSKSVTVAADAATVSIPLDKALLDDIATNPMNRGLVLFTTRTKDGAGAIFDFKTREARGQAVLVLEAKE